MLSNKKKGDRVDSSSASGKNNPSITNYAKRSEFIFLYDSRMANPNGDPDEDFPRLDPYSGRNLVTEYRLKRTIRDYILKHYKSDDKNQIFIREELKSNNKRKTIEELAEHYITSGGGDNQTKVKKKKSLTDSKAVKADEIINDHIDVRLFGLMFLVQNIPFKRLGPVQFAIGISLNKVQPILVRFIRVVPTKEDAGSGTFGEKTILKYSLILFHGFLNQIPAEETRLTEEDVRKMMTAMWHRTNELSTTSKYGQMSRFLLRIIYKNDNDYIGDLDRNLRLDNFDDQNIQHISEAQINAINLFKVLETNKNLIQVIQYACHPDLEFLIETKDKNEQGNFKAEIKNVNEYFQLWSIEHKIDCINIMENQE